MALCLTDTDSMENRSKPSALTWLVSDKQGQGEPAIGQWAADRGHSPLHLNALVRQGLTRNKSEIIVKKRDYYF